MHPVKRPTVARSIKRELAERVRAIIHQAYGETGIQHVAAALGLPSRTLLNYLSGCTIPAETILSIIELTGVHPNWLMTGLEPRYLARNSGGSCVDGDGNSSSGNVSDLTQSLN
jgi:hypothetical protein